jgi:hypothetical protein
MRSALTDGRSPIATALILASTQAWAIAESWNQKWQAFISVFSFPSFKKEDRPNRPKICLFKYLFADDAENRIARRIVQHRPRARRSGPLC